MKTFYVYVAQTVKVELDETKFDEAFMQEFREGFYSFDTLAEHAEHIAQLHARGLFDGGLWDEFIEGYGLAKDMGIKARVTGTDIDVISPIAPVAA